MDDKTQDTTPADAEFNQACQNVVDTLNKILDQYGDQRLCDILSEVNQVQFLALYYVLGNPFVALMACRAGDALRTRAEPDTV